MGRDMTTTIPDSHRDLLDQPVATLGTGTPTAGRS